MVGELPRTCVKVICLASLAAALHAQDYRARIQGVVTDSSQAVVAGATVTLTNVKTAVRTVRYTNETGRYVFDYVEPGWYTLSIELAGFSKFVQENIEVQSRGDVTVNVTLQPGALAESITVAESPVAVQFNSTNTILTLDTKLANELPRFDRNPFKLSLLNPAAVNTRTEMNPYHSWAANSVELGGGTNLKNDLLVDGSPIGIGHKAAYTPPPEAVQEVNIQQNSVDAEAGHSAGGVISMTLKSGTNEWTGNHYYLGRYPSLNALSDRTLGTKSAARYHIFGGNLGNPVLRNRLFQYFTYEQWKQSNPLSYIRTLPTAAERQGDFSRSLNIEGGLRAIFDPWTTVLDPRANVATRTPFPGNRIPASRFDGVAARLLKELWEPNNPGENITGQNNFKVALKQTTNYWNFSDRVDWNVSDQWRVYGRVSYLHTMVDSNSPSPTKSLLYVTQGASARHAFALAGDVIYTLNPTTLLNVHGDYHYLVDDYDSPRDKLGKEGWGIIWPHSQWYKPFEEGQPPYVPRFQIGGSQFGIASTYWYQHPNGAAFNAKLSRQAGAHYWKLGVDARRSGGRTLVTQTTLFQFDAAVTANTFISPNTRLVGHEYATFLLGALTSSSLAQVKPVKEPRASFYALFWQDDWKLGPRVTLNLGLRWEYETAWRDPKYRMSRGLDLLQPHPEMQANPPRMPAEALAIMGSYRFNGAWVFTDEKHPGMWNAPRANFMPRAGAAIRLDEKSAFRVGYGRYLAPTEFNFTSAPVAGFEAVNFLEPPYYGFDASQSPPPLLEGRPQAVLYDPFPPDRNPLIPPKGKAYGRYLGVGGDNLMWYYQNMKRAVNDRLSLSYQRQLPNHIVVDLTYFINLGFKWPNSVAKNMMDPRLSFQYKAELARSVPNPFYNYLTPEVFPGPLRNQRSVSLSSLLRPYPHYGALYEIYTPERSERYRSLQIRIQRSFRGGYNFLFGYVYLREKSLEYYDDVDHYLRQLSWQESNSPRHRFSVAGTYEIPVGKGRRYGSDMNRLLEAVVGGWQLVGVWYYNSGEFLRFGAMEVSGDPRIPNPTPQRWFNTGVFRQLTPYTRRSNPWQYEGLTGPCYWVIDGTVSKIFRLTERFRTELKLAAYNATNRLNWANPSTSVTAATFGQTLRQRGGTTGRQIELGMKLLF